MSTEGVSHRSINLKTVMVVPKGSDISVKLTGFDLATRNINDCIPEQYIFNVMPLWYLRRCMDLEASSPAERLDFLMVKNINCFLPSGRFWMLVFRRRQSGKSSMVETKNVRWIHVIYQLFGEAKQVID